MTLARAVAILACLALSAQTPDPVDLAWNDMATAGNAWRTQHNSLIWNKADHERLKKFESASRRFFTQAREAKF